MAKPSRKAARSTRRRARALARHQATTKRIEAWAMLVRELAKLGYALYWLLPLVAQGGGS